MENRTRKEGERREDAPENAPEPIEPEPEPRIGRVSRPAPKMRSDRFRSYVRSEAIDGEQSGNLAVRMYENETHARELIYKLELVRIYSMENGSGESFNFGSGDCSHGIHCFKWAQNWFWHHERWVKRNRARRWF